MRWESFGRRSLVRKMYEVRVLEFQLEVFKRALMR
jgi:hypothetical protein